MLSNSRKKFAIPLFALLFSGIILSACQRNSRLNISVNTCLIEVDKRWMWDSDGSKPTIYKVIGIKEKEYDVGVYQSEAMFFLGRKPASYFQETRKFKFEETPCPGSKDNKRYHIKDTLREIDLKVAPKK